jgi:hypothetical protein
MRLPGGERAINDLRRLRGYVLNPLHPRGRHKARVFRSALHTLQSDVELLRDTLAEAARTEEAVPGEVDEYRVQR